MTSTITDIRDAECALLGRILGASLRTQSLVSVMTLIDGLLVAVCAPDEPLPPAGARDILLGHIAGQPLVQAS